MVNTHKIKIFVLIVVFSVGFFYFFSRGPVYEPRELEYGLTFSNKQAVKLGLDWQEMFKATLYDLNVKKLRLSAYWDEVEAERDNYYWDDLDWQIAEARAAGAEVILAVGGRLPRWPECHFPDWSDDLSAAEWEQELLEYVRDTVLRYLGEEHIVAWQVENEPFLPYFGECPKTNAKLLDRELALVRSLDDRPIIVTDSGELSLWVRAAKRADIFGTTMYLDTYSRALKRYIHYPIRPGFFHFKRNMTKLFAKPERFIVIELQAEPWCRISWQEADAAERAITMDLEKFRHILEFARLSGFREFYLWGVEYWYWERVVNDNAEMWEEARGLFR